MWDPNQSGRQHLGEPGHVEDSLITEVGEKPELLGHPGKSAVFLVVAVVSAFWTSKNFPHK